MLSLYMQIVYNLPLLTTDLSISIHLVFYSNHWPVHLYTSLDLFYPLTCLSLYVFGSILSTDLSISIHLVFYSNPLTCHWSLYICSSIPTTDLSISICLWVYFIHWPVYLYTFGLLFQPLTCPSLYVFGSILSTDLSISVHLLFYSNSWSVHLYTSLDLFYPLTCLSLYICSSILTPDLSISIPLWIYFIHWPVYLCTSAVQHAWHWERFPRLLDLCNDGAQLVGPCGDSGPLRCCGAAGDGGGAAVSDCWQLSGSTGCCVTPLWLSRADQTLWPLEAGPPELLPWPLLVCPAGPT